jgi:hypothetical protein
MDTVAVIITILLWLAVALIMNKAWVSIACMVMIALTCIAYVVPLLRKRKE